MRYTKALINEIITRITKRVATFLVIFTAVLWVTISEIPLKLASADQMIGLSNQGDQNTNTPLLKDESSLFDLKKHSGVKVKKSSLGTFTESKYEHGSFVKLKKPDKVPLTVALKINSKKVTASIFKRTEQIEKAEILENEHGEKSAEMILNVINGKLRTTKSTNSVPNCSKEFYKDGKEKAYSSNLMTEFTKKDSTIVVDLEREVKTEADRARIQLYADSIIKEFFIEKSANLEKISDKYQFSLSFSEQIPESVISVISERLASKFNNLNGQNLSGVSWLYSAQANMLARIYDNDMTQLKDNSEKTILGVDFGASHLVSNAFTVKKNGKTVHAKSYKSYHRDDIGGNKIDKMLYDYFVEKMKNDENFEGNKNLTKFIKFSINNKLSDDEKRQNKDLYRITEALIKAKEKLSASGADDVAVDITLSGDVDYNTTLSNEEVNNLLKESGEIFKKHIEDHMKELKQQNIYVDEILITGGSLRIPYFQKILENVLNKENENRLKDKKISISKTLNHDESSALGASYIDVLEGFRSIGQVKTFKMPKVANNHKIVDEFWTMQDIKKTSFHNRNKAEQQIYAAENILKVEEIVKNKEEIAKKLKNTLDIVANGSTEMLSEAYISFAKNLEKFNEDPNRDFKKLSKYLDDWQKAIKEHLSEKDVSISSPWTNLPTLSEEKKVKIKDETIGYSKVKQSKPNMSQKKPQIQTKPQEKLKHKVVSKEEELFAKDFVSSRIGLYAPLVRKLSSQPNAKRSAKNLTLLVNKITATYNSENSGKLLSFMKDNNEALKLAIQRLNFDNNVAAFEKNLKEINSLFDNYSQNFKQSQNSPENLNLEIFSSSNDYAELKQRLSSFKKQEKLQSLSRSKGAENFAKDFVSSRIGLYAPLVRKLSSQPNAKRSAKNLTLLVNKITATYNSENSEKLLPFMKINNEILKMVSNKLRVDNNITSFNKHINEVITLFDNFMKDSQNGAGNVRKVTASYKRAYHELKHKVENEYSDSYNSAMKKKKIQIATF